METPKSHQYPGVQRAFGQGSKFSKWSIGETLPLFEGSVSPVTASGRVPRPRGMQDDHMKAAWRLAKALKAAKSGHRAGRDVAKLSPGQRHQVGTAICEHLLASLRQQVQSEHEVSKH